MPSSTLLRRSTKIFRMAGELKNDRDFGALACRSASNVQYVTTINNYSSKSGRIVQNINRSANCFSIYTRSGSTFAEENSKLI